MGMVYWHEVNVNGTEKDFISQLIDYITGIDSRITCSSNVDTEFNGSDLTHVPTFNFLINNDLSFALTRGAALDTNTNEYVFSCGSFSVGIHYQTAAAYTAFQVRAFFVSHFINDKFILLSINSSLRNWQNRVEQVNNNIIYAKSSSAKSYYSSVLNVSYEKNDLYNISARRFYEIGGSSSGLFISRFSYACPPGYIDYIKSASYIGNEQKQFDITAIYDCTTVAVGDTVSLKDGPYLAVGTNQLVKV